MSRESVPSLADYNGFGTIANPSEYLSAPAMIMLGKGEPSYSPTPVVQEAIEASRHFNVLNSDDVHGMEAEVGLLQTRIADVEDRLDIEHKMREAASSLSKLHINGGETESTSEHRSSKRLSRIFSASSSSPTKASQKRLSRQAAEEEQVSVDRIKHLEDMRNELVQRQLVVERTLLQHHSAVLALAALGQPIPDVAPSGLANQMNHQRHRSSISLPRKSIGARPESVGRPLSLHSIGSPVRNPQNQHRRGASHASTKLLEAPLEDHQSQLAAEVDSLVDWVVAAMQPESMTPIPEKVEFLRRAYMKLLQDGQELTNKAEAYHDQAQQAEARVQYMASQVREFEQSAATSQRAKGLDAESSARSQAELSSLKQELKLEQSKFNELRTQHQSQRTELERVVASLEDVTQLAVGYESEREEYSTAMTQLETQVHELMSERGELEAKLLATRAPDGAQGTSILCKEFQKVICELHEKHYKEMRVLRSQRLTPVQKSLSTVRHSISYAAGGDSSSPSKTPTKRSSVQAFAVPERSEARNSVVRSVSPTSPVSPASMTSRRPANLNTDQSSYIPTTDNEDAGSGYVMTPTSSVYPESQTSPRRGGDHGFGGSYLDINASRVSRDTRGSTAAIRKHTHDDHADRADHGGKSVRNYDDDDDNSDIL